MTDIFAELKGILPSVTKDESMAKHTTFQIGGSAEYFFIAHKKSEVLEAIEVAKKLQIPVFVMGGGSNLLVSDDGMKGLVVKVQNQEPIVLKPGNIVQAGSGVVFGDVVTFSINNSLQGLEWAGGLPGTFGGAVRGNAGAFGGETKDSIFEVEALDSNYELKTLSNEECHFSYRSSIFKEKNWVVLSASVKLKEGNKEELQKIAQSRISYRQEKHPLDYPNAGSVFKGVDVKKLSPEVQQLFTDKVKQDPFPIVPAAWFIIGAGLTGKTIGKAQISEKHSNYIINLGEQKQTMC
jgi:UDP-N-acetylmuramate dehydrogenase